MSIEVEIDGEHHRVTPPHQAKLATLDATIERLEEATTERWGDRWFIQTTQYTDGDFRAHATCGHTGKPTTVILSSIGYSSTITMRSRSRSS